MIYVSELRIGANCFRYRQAAEAFTSIFDIDPPTKVYYVPGNNDVG